MTPTDILRFLDQIDISLWATTSSYPQDDPAIVDFIVSSLNSEPALTWYRSLDQRKKLTVNTLRLALLKDFGVENWEAIMARYENANIYYNSQEFKLQLSYLDEIEGLKDQIKFRNKSALEVRKRINDMESMWGEIVARKDEKIEELELAARETGKLGGRFKGKGKAVGAEEAFQKFEKSVEEARERLKEDLGIQSYEGDLIPPPTQSPLPPELTRFRETNLTSTRSSTRTYRNPAPQTSTPQIRSLAQRLLPRKYLRVITPLTDAPVSQTLLSPPPSIGAAHEQHRAHLAGCVFREG